MTCPLINPSELIELLSQLIRINSVNPSLAPNAPGEKDIADFLFKYLTDCGLDTSQQVIAENRVNVIAVLKGSGNGKSIILNGHTDIVNIERMEIDPFEPTIKDGNIYGRGSLDMKGGLAAQIIAVKTLIDAGITLSGDVILTMVADEEYASIGTEEILKSYSADAAIICEPTGLDVVIAHKGFTWGQIEVFGRLAHGSLPQEGIDAIMKTGHLLSKMDLLEKENLSQLQHPLLGSPSMHASLISGGVELSTYPDYCKLELERRNLPKEESNVLETEICGLIDNLSKEDTEFKAKYQTLFHRPGFEITPEADIVQALTTAYEKTLLKKPVVAGMGGWLESALFAEAGIPAVVFGPSGEGLHAASEFVTIESLNQSAQVLVQTIIDFCQ